MARADRQQPELVEGEAPASRAIAATKVRDAEAMMIIAQCTRTDSCLPRRTICCSRRPNPSGLAGRLVLTTLCLPQGFNPLLVT